jgi:hypothetical protein
MTEKKTKSPAKPRSTSTAKKKSIEAKPTSAIQIQGEIAKRAYSLWEQSGRPDGSAERYWLLAEREVSATLR